MARIMLSFQDSFPTKWTPFLPKKGLSDHTINIHALSQVPDPMPQGDTDDPRGGVRHVFLGKAKCWEN